MLNYVLRACAPILYVSEFHILKASYNFPHWTMYSLRHTGLIQGLTCAWRSTMLYCFPALGCWVCKDTQQQFYYNPLGHWYLSKRDTCLTSCWLFDCYWYQVTDKFKIEYISGSSKVPVDIKPSSSAIILTFLSRGVRSYVLEGYIHDL